MRILQIHNSYLHEGGEDQLVKTEAAALREMGHEVFTAHVANPSTTVAQMRAFALAPWNPGAARSIEGIIDRYRPDLAHVHNTWYQLTPSVIAALSRRDVPVVMTVHNYRMVCANAVFFREGSPCTDCLGSHPWRAVPRRCYRDSMLQSLVAAGSIAFNGRRGTWTGGVDRFVVATEFARDVLITAGFAEERIRVVPPLVPDSGPRSSAPSESRSVVFMGRMDEGKGLDMLLDAWGRVDSGLELLLAGDGPLRPALESRGVPETRFVGWQERQGVDRILRTSRALAFPSMYFETLGLSLAEALAAGLPIVANAVGTRSEVLGTDGAGWLVGSNTVDEWVRVLSELADDSVVDSAGRAARARYEERFAPEAALGRLLAVFDELAPG